MAKKQQTLLPATRARPPPPPPCCEALAPLKWARHAHTVDMPHDTPLEMRGHCGGGEAQRGSQRQARVALGFTQTRASIWAPLWSLLAGLANVGRSRSHQLMSV